MHCIESKSLRQLLPHFQFLLTEGELKRRNHKLKYVLAFPVALKIGDPNKFHEVTRHLTDVLFLL